MAREGTQSVHNASSRKVMGVMGMGHDGRAQKSKAQMRVEWNRREKKRTGRRDEGPL